MTAKDIGVRQRWQAEVRRRWQRLIVLETECQIRLADMPWPEERRHMETLLRAVRLAILSTYLDAVAEGIAMVDYAPAL